jgi:hypothetical protein
MTTIDAVNDTACGLRNYTTPGDSCPPVTGAVVGECVTRIELA